MNHIQVLNYFINKYNYKSYLEIGTEYGYTFNQIKCPYKECCDPINNYNNLTYCMTSDDMFYYMDKTKKYDIIFIDGMHDEEYVDRDIINSLQHLNKNGIICLHDIIPQNALANTKYECFTSNRPWNGTVWKSITKLSNLNLEYYTLFTSDAITIIKYKENASMLSVPNYLSKIEYNYIFDDNYDFKNINHLTKQGQFVMHIIFKDDIDIYI